MVPQSFNKWVTSYGHDPSIQKPREVEETTDALTKLRRPWASWIPGDGIPEGRPLTVSARREQAVSVSNPSRRFPEVFNLACTILHPAFHGKFIRPCVCDLSSLFTVRVINLEWTWQCSPWMKLDFNAKALQSRGKARFPLHLIWHQSPIT